MEKTGGEFKEVGLAGLAILHIELPRLVYWVKLYCMVRRATVIATAATTQILFQLSEIQGKPNRMQHRDFQLKSVPEVRFYFSHVIWIQKFVSVSSIHLKYTNSEC